MVIHHSECDQELFFSQRRASIMSTLILLQVSKEQFNKILEMINIGKEQGAKLETGGGRIGDKGYYIEPTVFSDVKGKQHLVHSACDFYPEQ